jgi:serine/threonine protein kinase/tetratricopeptide (TPR) repeat protein
MGVVYHAIPIAGGPAVALKMPSEEISDFFGNVRREIHALGRLRHPGVVRILDEGVEKGVPWYVMELLDARSLDELLNIVDVEDGGYGDGDTVDLVQPFEPHTASLTLQGGVVGQQGDVRADLTRALTLMYRLARVLAAVHAHGIVHRDLKPQNVLVRPGDLPVLVDFGLMGEFRAETGREVLEVSGTMMGTAVYTSPEQISGELVDARADLYAFGIMLYELVTGQTPFHSRAIHNVLMMHLTKPPAPPSTLVRGVPPVLETLILNLLAKQRADRLGYAEDVAERLVEAGAEPDSDFRIETAAYLYRPEIVGRKETIDSLRKQLPDVRKGAGAFIMLGGVSGIGKTSVAAAFAREAAIGKFEVITAECDPIGRQPLHPLRPLLRAIADHCRGHADEIERILGARLDVLREHEPSLAALTDESAIRIPAEVAARRLLIDLSTTLAAFADNRPMLLVLDDLQWADELTLRFLSSLGPTFFEGRPLIILGTYRVDEAGDELRAILAQDHVSSVLLGRLDDTNVAQIVRSMLAAPDAPASFLNFLAAQTEGNPFFIAEYLRAAVAERLLFREHGRWHVATEDETYASLGLPGTVRDLVARRLDRLSPLAQRVAEAAAVLGREVPEERLIAACGDNEQDAREGIAELIEQHMLESMGNGVRFAHDKLREGAYARVTEERRRSLHARAAAIIEESCTTDDEVTRHAAELAHHCDIAGLREKAIGYYAEAAEAAVGSGACREAIDLMTRAIVLDAPRATEQSARRRRLRHARWHRVLCFAHFGLGDVALSAEHARKSLSEAGVHLPRTLAGWRLRFLIEAARQAIHLVMPRRISRGRAAKQSVYRDITLAAQKFSEGRYYTDELTVMVASGLLAVNSAERLNDAATLIHAYANIGGVATGVGLHRLARRYYKEARRLAISTNDRAGVGHIGYSSAMLYVTTCDWKSCALYLDDAVAAAKEVGDHQVIEVNETVRGLYELCTGRLATAAETFATVRDRAHSRLNVQHEAWGHACRAAALLLMGRPEEALECVNAALKLLEGQSEKARLLCHAHRTHALLHTGKLNAALESADVTYSMVMKTRTILWERFRCLSAPAEVYLEAWRRAREVDPTEVERMRRAVRVLLKRLEAVSRRMPLVLPITLRLTGMAECLEGQDRAGEKLLRNSIAAAQRLQLPIDEGIAEYELVRHAILDPTERNAHRERARTLFRATGCKLYLRKMDASTARPKSPSGFPRSVRS